MSMLKLINCFISKTTSECFCCSSYKIRKSCHYNQYTINQGSQKQQNLSRRHENRNSAAIKRSSDRALKYINK